MGKNVGGLDRAARAILGIALLSIVFVGPQTPLGWIGLILLGTALVGWCPIYRVFGIGTCRECDSHTG